MGDISTPEDESSNKGHRFGRSKLLKGFTGLLAGRAIGASFGVGLPQAANLATAALESTNNPNLTQQRLIMSNPQSPDMADLKGDTKRFELLKEENLPGERRTLNLVPIGGSVYYDQNNQERVFPFIDMHQKPDFKAMVINTSDGKKVYQVDIPIDLLAFECDQIRFDAYNIDGLGAAKVWRVEDLTDVMNRNLRDGAPQKLSIFMSEFDPHKLDRLGNEIGVEANVVHYFKEDPSEKNQPPRIEISFLNQNKGKMTYDKFSGKFIVSSGEIASPKTVKIGLVDRAAILRASNDKMME